MKTVTEKGIDNNGFSFEFTRRVYFYERYISFEKAEAILGIASLIVIVGLSSIGTIALIRNFPQYFGFC